MAEPNAFRTQPGAQGPGLAVLGVAGDDLDSASGRSNGTRLIPRAAMKKCRNHSGNRKRTRRGTELDDAAQRHRACQQDRTIINSTMGICVMSCAAARMPPTAYLFPRLPGQRIRWSGGHYGQDEEHAHVQINHTQRVPRGSTRPDHALWR
jgi:hypothetical protein